jgi:Fuc2NAc and GlcNAc transferase
MSLLCIILLLISFSGTFIIIKVAVRKNILDIPNERSSHTQPTPRGGGLAIVVSWYIGLFVMKLSGNLDNSLFFALLSGLALAIISFLDDIYNIKPAVRLLVQVGTSVAGLFFLGGLKVVYADGLSINSNIILTLVATFGIIWFINLFNFLDGIDGYASIQAIVTALGIFVVTGSPLTLILVFSVLGFLTWNWPKALVFMGDIGSTQLGYVLIILGLYYGNNHEISIAGWLILTSLFWVDATVTLYRRWRNSEKLSVAHKKHFYQRLVRSGYSHKQVVLWQIFISVFFIGLVWLSENNFVPYLLSFPLCLAVNFLLARFIDTRFNFNRTE